ncbi:DNA-methyltransferase [Mycoplasmopsis verecunda]|uniref:Methyltransferase n=1 Tax=Mycoplasmopsis verecunda TaxID=171291 RepID=A0A1T4L665_9BACT|nr:site-specific DNA-methyltransferase [Mycoplasmopsis verecunda]WPB54786.1 site-specific DNA-methyltransferase [Mycoplasmopsis verecunda]SJZ50205.1 site-specific DNA-methyltransferase (adenine-specific) [Mycoplasmopsis verecunda]
MKPYFKDSNFTLYNDDCIDVLSKLPPKSIDMIFADPPYFLSGNGISCQSGKQVSVYKASWDEIKTIEEKITFNRAWITKAKEVLKDDGTIWISGTYHNIYGIGVSLELEGFSILNNITWQKPNPTPNLGCRCFTHSTETILWARKIINNKKAAHYFNYDLMKQINDNKQMKDVWTIKLPSKSEKTFGKHPTQKPFELLERIILASTKENDIVLDPFNGSGTTGIACIKLNRKYIGIDTDKDYLELSIKRYNNIKDNND